MKKQLYLAFVVCAMCACSDSNTEIEMRKNLIFMSLSQFQKKSYIQRVPILQTANYWCRI